MRVWVCSHLPSGKMKPVEAGRGKALSAPACQGAEPSWGWGPSRGSRCFSHCLHLLSSPSLCPSLAFLFLLLFLSLVQPKQC